MNNQRLQILIIEDSSEDQETIRRLLKKDPEFEYLFLQAFAGEEGLSLVGSQMVDCILLDYRLPDMDGLDFMAELSGAGKQISIPIVFLTGTGDEEVAVQAMKSGAMDYLTKDKLTPDLLARTIRYAIEKKQSEEALKNRTHELQERVKELNCLLAISTIVEKPSKALEEIMQGIVDMVPPGWQYPEITCARLILEEQTFQTKNFKETFWKQAQDIIVHGKQAGTLEVCYLEERPESHEGAFLKEERNLINAIAIRIAKIIERKQAEKELERHRDHLEELIKERTDELRKSEEMLRGVMETVPIGIGISTPGVKGTVTEVNTTLWKLFGYDSRDEFLKLPASAHYHDPKERYQFSKLREQGPVKNYEARFKRKDGTVFWGSVSSITQTTEDGTIQFLNTFEDNTERKQAEEELRLSRERYQKITEAITDYIYTVQIEDGRPVRTIHGSACKAVTGYTSEEFFNDPSLWMRMVPEEDRDIVQKYSSHILLNHDPKKIEHRVIRKDGAIRWVSNTPIPHWDVQGNVISYDGLIRDITERKIAEEEIIRQSNVVDAINMVLREALTCENDAEVADTCLSVAEELTGSKFGLIGEVNPAGRFDTMAISNPGWDACKMPDSDATRLIKDMEIRGIDRSVIREEKSRIVNDLTSHADRVGFPEGHPPVTSFLGVPLKSLDKTIGMIGLGNKWSGYDLADQKAIEKLSIAFVEALDRKRFEIALADSEKRYRDLVELSPEAVYVHVEGEIVYINLEGGKIIWCDYRGGAYRQIGIRLLPAGLP